MSNPLLLLEINEVPWRLLDRFRGHYKHIDHFFAKACTKTNVARDTGELSPWITWPTFHRGMLKEGHRSTYLGQDPNTFEGRPIWQEFRERGLSIGVFGSMQSWPPEDPGEGGFYIPDTFAHDAQCIPRYLEPPQAFNLLMTGENKRVIARSSLINRQLLRCLTLLSPGTLAAGGWQLATELVSAPRTARRPVFQAIVMWDVFQNLYNVARPPAFSSFFTNHVAGIMHRYWKHVFPEDFPDMMYVPGPHISTMRFALKVLDRILGDVIVWCRRNPKLRVVFASSMGQGPVFRKYHEGVELVIADVHKLLACLGIEQGFKQLLAMTPQTGIEIPSGELRKIVRERLEACQCVSGKQLFKVQEIGDSLSISIGLPPKSDVDAQHWFLGPGGFTWEQGGIQVHQVEAGSGYHVPEGAMALYGHEIVPDHNRAPIYSDMAKDLLMELAQL